MLAGLSGDQGEGLLSEVPEYYVQLSDSDDNEGSQDGVQEHEFEFDHRDDNNFEHYMEPGLCYMVSLVRNPRRAQYGSLNLMNRLIQFLYFFLRKQSTCLRLGTQTV